MADVTIDKDIPIPWRNSHTMYPWLELEVGDSFFVANRTAVEMGQRWRHVRLKHPHLKFTARANEEHGVAGVRVWRIE